MQVKVTARLSTQAEDGPVINYGGTIRIPGYIFWPTARVENRIHAAIITEINEAHPGRFTNFYVQIIRARRLWW